MPYRSLRTRASQRPRNWVDARLPSGTHDSWRVPCLPSTATTDTKDAKPPAAAERSGRSVASATASPRPNGRTFARPWKVATQAPGQQSLTPCTRKSQSFGAKATDNRTPGTQTRKRFAHTRPIMEHRARQTAVSQKAKERGVVHIKKRIKEKNRKQWPRVLRKKPEQTTNEHERNMNRYNKQKKRETNSPRTRSKLTRPMHHLQSEQWMLESCETKQIMLGSKQASPGDETTKLVQAKLPRDGTSEEELEGEWMQRSKSARTLAWKTDSGETGNGKNKTVLGLDRSRTRHSHLKALQYIPERLSSFANWAQMWTLELANKDEAQLWFPLIREVDNPNGSTKAKLRPIALLETTLTLIVAVHQHADHIIALMQEQQVGFQGQRRSRGLAQREIS